MTPLRISHYTATTALGRGRAAQLAGLREERTGLREKNFETCTLEVSYRCPPGVTDLARDVRAGVRARPPAPGREREVAQVRFDHECHLASRVMVQVGMVCLG